MMTRELEVSILAAPLAAIDRRELSQAWYSALRLATPQCAGGVRHCSGRTGPLAEVVQIRARGSASDRNAGIDARCARFSRCESSRPAEEEDLSRAQRSRSSLARRIERTFADARSRPKRATFSLGRGNARVHIMLQSTGTSAMLLALCRPEVRAVVRDALAQARALLAARGISLELHIAEGGRCSLTRT
ncbi:MAG: hypothetical protein JO113_03365 [Candidatus Eremiobacteraeota bacterium]|nr:hypothetical protein [Candidatus Eremiobacteraeota bacterium]